MEIIIFRGQTVRKPVKNADFFAAKVLYYRSVFYSTYEKYLDPAPSPVCLNGFSRLRESP